MEVKDREHVRAILAEFPLDETTLDLLVEQMPARQSGIDVDRVARFEAGLTELAAMRRMH